MKRSSYSRHGTMSTGNAAGWCPNLIENDISCPKGARGHESEKGLLRALSRCAPNRWLGSTTYLYPRIPPQGIFFESLVEKAFKTTSAPFARIEASERNAPEHDLLVDDARISVKSETGRATRQNFIHITKRCTTKKDPWEAGASTRHVLDHLSRDDLMLSLRAVWNDPVIEYQLVDIPIKLLKKISRAAAASGLSGLSLKALVSLFIRLIHIRIVKFCRST